MKYSIFDMEKGKISDRGDLPVKNLHRLLQLFGEDAREALMADSENIRHAIYGRKLYSGEGDLLEVQLYTGCLCNEEAFDRIARSAKSNTIIYAVHKH